MASLKRLMAASLVIALFTFSLFLMRSQSSSAPDFDTVQSVQELPEITIEIPDGATGSQIASILYESGVVKSSEAYFRVAVGDTRSQKVAPGSHRLTLKISARQALDQLLDPDRIPNLIRVAEGAWKSEVQSAFINYGFTKQEVSKAFSSLRLPQGFSNSEGLIFPAQYSFPQGTSAQSAAQSMIDRFSDDLYGKKLLQGSKDFSAKQLLTIASIVQAESTNEDFSKVARVIYNRLRIGMPLQMDSTVHFIMQARGDIFLSRESTTLNSPYNTYKKYGLPPGPIWLYFVTVAPGDTRFTASFDEFSQWKVEYTKNRKAGAFN